jgi:hypothetical protein
LFEEVIHDLLLGLDLIVHVLILLLEPVHSQVGFVEIPLDADGRCSFGVFAKGLAALAGLVVLFAAALVDPVDVHFQLGLQQLLLFLAKLRLHLKQAL